MEGATVVVVQAARLAMENQDQEGIHAAAQSMVRLAKIAPAQQTILGQGGLPALLRLAQSEDPKHQTAAAAGLAFLGEMDSNRAILIAQGGIGVALELLGSPLVSVRASAAKAIALFSGEESCHDELMELAIGELTRLLGEVPEGAHHHLDTKAQP